MTTRPAPRLDVLDGLRGLAILLVMLLHYWEITWFNFKFGPVDLSFLATTGSLGVTLFFFISGFCLFLSYDRAPETASYIRKRFFKIVPSYVLASAIIFVFFSFPFQGFQVVAKHFITHLLFIHNWWSDTYGSINGVFWSLAVEVQFYYLFPFIFPLVKKRPAMTLFGFFVVAQSFRLAVRAYNPDPFDFWLNQLPAFIDIFVGGIAAGVWYKRLRDAEKRPVIFGVPAAATAFGMAGFALLLAQLWFAHSRRYDLGIVQLQVWMRGGLLISFLMLSLGSCFGMRWWNLALANPATKLLSRISYNLYIWHQFIGMELFKAGLPPYIGNPHGDLAWQPKFLLIAASISIVFTYILTRFFEEPILNRTR